MIMEMKASTLVIIYLAAAAAFVQAQNETNTSQAPNTDDDVSTENPTTTTAGTTSAQSTPTTTPTPTPAEPEAGKWFINNTGTKDICLMVNLGARFKFNYNATGNKNYTQVLDLPLPQNGTIASGHCSNQTSNITLTYNSACSMRMDFQKKDNKFSVDKIVVSFDTKCFKTAPTVNVTGTLENQTLFQATVGQSYMCNSQQDFNIADNNINQMTLELVDLQVQAYMNQTNTNFGTAQECPQDAETSNIVPIAVGAALAALVLIVLIAYLISRNRGQRGYESV